MKICAVSDLHGFLPDIAPCDLLLVAGDSCPIDRIDVRRQREWAVTSLVGWMQEIPAAHIVWIAGNYDAFLWSAGPPRPLARLSRGTYLQDSEIEVDGLRIWGTPWTQGLGAAASWWAFDLAIVNGADPFARIPEGTDIVLSHSPLLGIGDMTLAGRQVGSPQLLDRVEEIQPRLVVHGHVHEGHGRRLLRAGADVIVANAAVRGATYEPTQGVMMTASQWKTSASSSRAIPRPRWLDDSAIPKQPRSSDHGRGQRCCSGATARGTPCTRSTFEAMTWSAANTQTVLGATHDALSLSRREKVLSVRSCRLRGLGSWASGLRALEVRPKGRGRRDYYSARRQRPLPERAGAWSRPEVEISKAIRAAGELVMPSMIWSARSSLSRSASSSANRCRKTSAVRGTRSPTPGTRPGLFHADSTSGCDRIRLAQQRAPTLRKRPLGWIW